MRVEILVWNERNTSRLPGVVFVELMETTVKPRRVNPSSITLYNTATTVL